MLSGMASKVLREAATPVPTRDADLNFLIVGFFSCPYTGQRSALIFLSSFTYITLPNILIPGRSEIQMLPPAFGNRLLGLPERVGRRTQPDPCNRAVRRFSNSHEETVSFVTQPFAAGGILSACGTLTRYLTLLPSLSVTERTLCFRPSVPNVCSAAI